MSSSWFQFVKKYVWDEDSTPYYLAPTQMHRRQAHKEVCFYAIFVGTFVGMVTTGALVQVYTTQETTYLPVLGYGLSLLAALYWLATQKHPWAVLYSASLPMAIFAVFFLYGFHPNNTYLEKVLLSGFLAFWLIYAHRLLNICRIYPDMEEANP